MDVVVVESPAKAKTIEKYLGPGYKVLASYGHVRDLPSKEGSVEPDKDFAMHYEIEGRAAKALKDIADALKKGVEHLYLATDPDREGEAISWHVLESLAQRNVLRNVDVKRVVFTEITRSAVKAAMAHPRDIDMDLVNAQQARRALDYLVGFTLSPVLWRKLPGAKSAGRVQSVALRLICEREIEIEAFRPREYWTVDVDLAGADGQPFAARLVELDGRKLDKFDLANAAAAHAASARIEAADLRVAEVQTRPAKRHPAPPFTTSTLQQEAARKLGFSAQNTMSIAQRLYEGVDIGGETIGLITYMRTDGVTMADEAVRGAREAIAADFGAEYVPQSWRVYKTKAKAAQEAHEAIRPTDFARRPEAVARYLDEAQRKLYSLIWTRAIACQMESAELERTTVEIADGTGRIGLRATGTVVLFPGFLKLYEEGRDDNGHGEDGARLPRLAAGEALRRLGVRPDQHFTEPPPRYSEASLVKRLEELGIGRPSTYASILEVLRERSYVRMDKSRFVPEDKGRLVTAFLTGFFERYFDYDFTANLEEQLDEIAERHVDWKQVLRDFWLAFTRADKWDGHAISVKEAVAHLDKDIGTRKVVIDAIDLALGPHFFPDRGDGKDPRGCPACAAGRLGIKLGRNGAFIGCSNYPDCNYTRPLAVNGGGEAAALPGPRLLGTDPATGLPVTLRSGPFGLYVQLGEAEGKEKKPKRASLPKGTAPDQVELGRALKLLALPRIVGPHPDSGKPITAGLGRFGPYLEHDGRYVRLDSAEEAIEIGLNRAVDLIAEAAARGRGRRRREAQPLRELGAHPEDGQPVVIMPGKYGPYVKHGKINATLPKGTAPEDMSLEAALARLAAEAAGGKGRRGARSKAATTKAAKGAGARSPGKTRKAPAPKASAAE